MGRSAIENTKTGLEINEHVRAHRAGFVAQSVGVGVIALTILAAGLGLFGDGVLSKKTIHEREFEITYERFYRREGRMKVEVKMPLSDATNTISFSNHYLKDVRIDAIVPEPNEIRIENNTARYTFSGSGEIIATFYLVPQKTGSISGAMSAGNHTFLLSHFIYP